MVGTVEAPQRRLVFRHPLLIRVSHWLNAIALTILLFSGLQIFNAHPALYWGQISNFDHPFVSLFGEQDNSGRIVKGVTQIGPWRFNTTGLFGASYDDGQLAARPGPLRRLPRSRFAPQSRRPRQQSADAAVAHDQCFAPVETGTCLRES